MPSLSVARSVSVLDAQNNSSIVNVANSEDLLVVCSLRVVAWRMAFELSRTTTCLMSEIWDLLVHRHCWLPWWFEKAVVHSQSTSTTCSPSGAQHSEADIAVHFTTKFEKVRSANINAPPPIINVRQSTTFADLVPVSVEEAAKLLKSAPKKHCQLDPTPTWILRKSADRFAPLFPLCLIGTRSTTTVRWWSTNLPAHWTMLDVQTLDKSVRLLLRPVWLLHTSTTTA